MALKERVPLRIGLRYNENVKSAGYHKWYGEVVLRQGLTQRGLIEHIMNHIPGISKSQVQAVIETMSQCLPELVGQGVSVKLDGIGVFYPTLNTQRIPSGEPGGPKDYSRSKAQLLQYGANASDVVRGVRFRFRPDSTKLDNLTSKKFKNKTSIEIAGLYVKKPLPNDEVVQVLITREDYKNSLTNG